MDVLRKCTHIYMCIMQRNAHPCIHVLRLVVDVRCLPLSLSILFINYFLYMNVFTIFIYVYHSLLLRSSKCSLTSGPTLQLLYHTF